ncbi:MAG: hypothetical protein Q9160_004846 [Pyrenula sp. 1 TL-2023]
MRFCLPQIQPGLFHLTAGRHILEKEKDLEPVFICWDRKDLRNDLPYQQYLEQEKSRWQGYNEEYRPRNPKATTVYLIDEAQDSYEEEHLWTQTLKSHNTRQKPMFVLVCLYGAIGTSRMREPGIESRALLMDHLQRIELRQSVPGQPYMLFKPDETADTVQKWAILNNLHIGTDISEYLHTATDGHPGMVGVILWVAYRRLFSGPEPGSDTGLQRISLQQSCLNAIARFSPSVLRLRKITGIPEATYQDELYCCLNYELRSLPILSEYSPSKDGRIDFYIFDKKWGIEVLQPRSKADITEHIRRFQTGGKYQRWNILDDYVILNFCSKASLQQIEIKDTSIQPRFLQIVIDPEECTAEIYTFDKRLRETIGLGEGRRKYRDNDFTPSESSERIQILQQQQLMRDFGQSESSDSPQTLQNQLLRMERERGEMERKQEEMERERGEMERKQEEMKRKQEEMERKIAELENRSK